MACEAGAVLGGKPGKLKAGAEGSDTVNAIVWLAAPPWLSRTVTITFETPAVVGVPLMTPAGEIVSPAGKPVALHVSGATPDEAVSVTVYGAPTVGVPSDGGLMLGAVTTASWKVFVVTAPLASVTVTVTVTGGPTAVVVPLIVPPGEIVSPAGNPVAVHVYGGVPFDTVRVVL